MKRTMAGCVAVALVFAATACGGSESGESSSEAPPASTASPSTTPTSTDSPTTTASPGPTSEAPTSFAGPAVEVTITGDEVTPKGDRIDAKVGEPVTFIVQSDRAGGLHVHSSPEQTPEFVKGMSILEVVIDRPGLVEVEEHESGALIVQLEVR